MKILLMGGTGVLGAALGPFLSSNHINSVDVTSRKKRNGHDNLNYIQGDAKELNFIIPLIQKENYDVIVDFMLYSVNEFKERINLLLSNTKHYIFISSSRVYAESKHPLTEDSSRLLDITNDSEYLKDFEYSLYKAKEEDILNNTTKKNWSIIRPYKTYNEDRMQLGVFEKEQFADRVIRGKKIVFLKDCIDKYTSLTHNTDVAKVLSEIAQRAPSGKIYQIASPQRKTWNEILNIYVSAFNSQGFNFEYVLTNDYKSVAKIFHNRYRMKYDGFLNRFFSDCSIQKEFGPFNWIPLEKGLTESVAKYIDERKHRIEQIDYTHEAFFDRITKEREPISSIKGIKNKIKYIFFRYFPQKIVFSLRSE